MVFNKQQQKPKALPHLSSKGVAIPEVKVPSQHHEIAMPGQKPLPNANWKEQQLVPSSQGNSGNNRKVSVQRQGLPWTERGNYENHPEPPPMFSATPSKKTTIRHVREPNAQKQVYRMDGGLDPVTLLTSRLECWRLAVKSISSLFKKISAVELKTSKGLIDASKEVVVPFEKGQGQFLELGSGGVQDVWSSLRDYTVQHGILQHESSGYIDKAVVPTLRAIKTDIKTMIASIQKDKDLKSDAIFESRLKIDKLIGRLDKTIEFCNRAPQQADQHTDPFLINLHIIHAIRELCDSENQLHDHLLNLQKEVGFFEQKIVENVRYVIKKYQDFRLRNKMEHNDFIGKVIETFEHVRPSLEWNEFIRRNQYNLILENSAYKTEDMVQYPNQFSNFVRAIKIGPLKAKTGALKGFSKSIHILTPAGFLHGYKSAKYFQENPLQPSYSIFVPDCDIEYDDDGVFQLRSNNRRMGMGTNCIFRPQNPRDGQEWIDDIIKISDQNRVVPLFDSSYYSTAPTTRHLPALPDKILPAQIEQRKPAAAIENKGESSRGETPQQRGESDLDPVLEGEAHDGSHHEGEAHGDTEGEVHDDNEGEVHDDNEGEVHDDNEGEVHDDNDGAVLENESLPHPAAAIARSGPRRQEKQPLHQEASTPDRQDSQTPQQEVNRQETQPSQQGAIFTGSQAIQPPPHQESVASDHQSVDTVTQPTYNANLSQLDSPKTEVPEKQLYTGLGATHAVQSVEQDLDQPTAVDQSKSQDNFIQENNNQSHTRQEDENSVDWHSITNEGFDHEKTIQESEDHSDDNIEQVKKNLEQYAYIPVNEAHRSSVEPTANTNQQLGETLNQYAYAPINEARQDNVEPKAGFSDNDQQINNQYYNASGTEALQGNNGTTEGHSDDGIEQVRKKLNQYAYAPVNEARRYDVEPTASVNQKLGETLNQYAYAPISDARRNNVRPKAGFSGNDQQIDNQYSNAPGIEAHQSNNEPSF